MHSLNPFIRAFFKSTLPSQCSPVNQHILLVPTTEVLLTSRDQETGYLLTDLVTQEDFLCSHVLRVPEPAPAAAAKEVGSVRDNRGKAKQFITINGRTVVVKESFVYSNKGFRNLNQAQLLTDSLYYNDSLDAAHWLIYYISRPLVGSIEPIKITPATLPSLLASIKPPVPASPEMWKANGDGDAFPAEGSAKKDIKSFNDLLNNFPMIARQMQPGLEKVFKDFNRDIGKPLPAPGPKSVVKPSRRASSSSTYSNGSISSKFSNGHISTPSLATTATYADDEEDHMRKTLETAVTAAIDLFQLVDKQQLSLLGATTDLTGPVVERLIERYVTEQVHDSVLFPRIRSIRRSEDEELDICIHQMVNIDIAQVGIEIEGGRVGKQELTDRLNRGVAEFKKLSVAGSPQEMVDILLATQKTLTMAKTLDQQPNGVIEEPGASEKPKTSITMNADSLVSMLLVVVIRSQVHYLQARLAYMRSFIFIDDVEGGEIGYALSTFEAVLSYLASGSGSLKAASRRNKRLWQATKTGNLEDMRGILEPGPDAQLDGLESPPNGELGKLEDNLANGSSGSYDHLKQESRAVEITSPFTSLPDSRDELELSSSSSTLAHVFPFQAVLVDEPLNERPRPAKRVSMDLRSLSNASEYSFKSRTTTIDSRTTAIEGDTSIEKLCQTEDSSGDSVLMMAVEARQAQALDYLLSLEEYYPSYVVLEDCNSEGVTLLSAAVQLAHEELMSVFVSYMFKVCSTQQIRDYLGKQDKRGRTVAHWLFNAPQLILTFGTLLPWRLKDKNGQTPLLALCRSYDHPTYLDMVNEALQFAMDEQPDNDFLHLDLHVDGKGNTLLHVVSDSYLALRMLQYCDANPNAPNNKQFTPLMVASKFGRFDLIRSFFLDTRVDIYAKEHRGMTAVELAKDDDVRNRIDDMVLVSNPAASDGRVTAIVRSFFVEDATIRLIIKSAARAKDGMIAVTTCRRSLSDFETLAKCLAMEQPASWLPSVFNFRSPFQIPSKPSRAVLHDIQVRLNNFLRIMLCHSSFSTHELLWEFILAPEMQLETMAERSKKKAELRTEKILEEYEPIEDVQDIETFVAHARESIRSVNHSTKSTVRRVNNIRNVSADFSTSIDLASKAFSTLTFLPEPYTAAISNYSLTFPVPESDPYKSLHQELQAISSTILATLSSLSRPHGLVASLQSTQKAIERHHGSLRRSDRWPLGLLDETRKNIHLDAQQRLEKSQVERINLGCELRYTQQTVAGELAGWQDLHRRMVGRAVRRFVKGMVIRERERLEGMKRALRPVLEERGGKGVGSRQ
ncbi:MAG: hypothetical protein MMC33_004311 [Icmadophila ericetorum]|nr:hypothetical protein [Icmadophila ericetorum]